MFFKEHKCLNEALVYVDKYGVCCKAYTCMMLTQYMSLLQARALHAQNF